MDKPIIILAILFLSIGLAVATEVLSDAPLFSEAPTKMSFFVGRFLETLLTVCKLVWIGCIISGVLIGFNNRDRLLPFLNHLLLLVVLFLIVFIIYFFGCKISSSFDSRWSIHTTMSIIKEGNTNLDEYKNIIEKEEYYGIEFIDNHIYTVYPIGTSFLAIPYVFLMDNFFKRSLAIDLEQFISDMSPRGLEILIASNFVALSTVFIYLIGNLLLNDRNYSLLLAFIFAFCTSAWSTASRALWQHGPSALLLSVSLYMLLLAKFKPKHASWIIPFVSIPLAFSYIVRPTNSLSILLFTIFILIRYRKHFLSYCLWSMVVIIPFVLFNLTTYHSFLPLYYYAPHQIHISLRMVEALAGTLFSPSRGLFIFTPVLLFSVYGIILKIRHKQMDIIDYFILTMIIVHWVLSSSHPHWWGGHSYGPRYFTDILPYFMYFLISGVAKIPKLTGSRKISFVFVLFCSVAISFFIHFRGATNWDVHYWNSEPINVDTKPSRVWDWHDIQFLRGIQ